MAILFYYGVKFNCMLVKHFFYSYFQAEDIYTTACKTVTEFTVERLTSSTTVAFSRRDRPHNIRITTLLFTIDVSGFFTEVPVGRLGLRFNVLVREDAKV